MPEGFTFEQTGYRDLHWCWNCNEPFIVSYDDDDLATCSFGCPPRDAEDGPGRDWWVSEHPFIAHIVKPVGRTASAAAG